MDISQLLLNRPVVQPAGPEMTNVSIQEDQAKHAQQLVQTARQFEAVFLHQLVKQMQETVNYASLDEDDESGEQIQAMYWSFMTDAMAEQGGLGLWKTIYNDLAEANGIDTTQFPPKALLDGRA